MKLARMAGALALQDSGRRQSIKPLLPPIHLHSLFRLLGELGRYRLKLNSQYINFWGVLTAPPQASSNTLLVTVPPASCRNYTQQP